MQTQTTKPMSPTMKFIFARIFPWVFLLAGAAMLFFGPRVILRRQKHGVAQRPGDRADFHGRVSKEHRFKPRGRRVLSRQSFLCLPGEKGHCVQRRPGRRPLATMARATLRTPRNIVNRYPVGKRVPVYYMPDEPKECVPRAGAEGPGVDRARHGDGVFLRRRGDGDLHAQSGGEDAAACSRGSPRRPESAGTVYTLPTGAR